jgi:hypothetical protein
VVADASDPIHPDQLDAEARFRADLVSYLDSLPVPKLAELLRELPSRRQQPLGLRMLKVALNERLPDASKLLPPAGHPGPGEGRRRLLREVVADRRAARSGRHPDASALWLPTASGRPTCTPSGAGRARWASGGWPRRCAPEPATPTRRPAGSTTATRRPSRRAGTRPTGPGGRQ